MSDFIKTVLGVDIGTNSIGWALLDLGDQSEIQGIRAMGSRIFPDGRNAKSLTSLNADRRAARLMRRQRDRHIQRRSSLLHALVEHNLMPDEEHNRKELEKLDPYQMRALAATSPQALVSLAKKICLADPNHLVGRALFHINQRRGFKSNRKTDKGRDDGPVKESISTFSKLLNGDTVGQFLWKRRRRYETVRARREGTKKTDLYDYYPERKMLESEFDVIWKTQAVRDPSVFSDDSKRVIRDIIFNQRQLKPSIVGKCQFMPECKRASRALPSYQLFRILQEVNNLRYRTVNGEWLELPQIARNDIVAGLRTQGRMSFGKMLRILKSYDETACSLKRWGAKRDELDGDATNAILKKLGNAWKAVPENKRDDLITELLSDEDDEAVCGQLVCKWGMTDAQAEELVSLAVRLPDGHSRLSLKAITCLLPHLMEGLGYYDAVRAAGFDSRNNRSTLPGTGVCLPPYQSILSQYCLPRTTDDEGNPEKWRIPNPTVHVALNQLRSLVNDIILKYGKPSKYVVELARELPKGAKEKREMERRQAQNQKDRELLRVELKRYGILPNESNLRKLILWQETGNTHDRACVFCGRKIGISTLFSRATHIEHILPRSRTLDDSMSNKTIACQACNEAKGNHTPFEAFGTDETRYEQILARAERVEHKYWRFKHDAMERYNREHDDFLARHLTDTQYIARATKQYLECIAAQSNILVVPGLLTAFLRHEWGLNDILSEIRNEPTTSIKNRKDHRHHAIDAVVIGTFSRALLQKLATEAARAESQGYSKFATEVPSPFHNFRVTVKDAVSKIVVSHKVHRRRNGQLHKDTAYGFISGPDSQDKYEVVHRVMLRDLEYKQIDKIRDKIIQRELKQMPAGKEFKKAVAQYTEEKNIRRIRIVERLSVIPMPANNPYKGYWAQSNWAYDIYELPNGNWGWEIISTFDANKHDQFMNSQGEPVKRYTHIPRWAINNPQAKLVTRIHAGDMLAQGTDESRVIFRVQKISKRKITLAPHFEANTAQRDKDKADSFKFDQISSIKTLRNRGLRKIHISPTGHVIDAGPHPNSQ